MSGPSYGPPDMSDPRLQAPLVSPDTTRGTVGRTLLRIRPLGPSRSQWIDAAFGLLLCGLALWGFRDTYSDGAFLVVGLVGVLLGLTLAHLAHAMHTPVIVLVAATVLAFFLIGPLAALGSAPTPDSFRDLAEISVVGWKDLLTTLPPVDGDGPLLVLPYLLGLVAASLAQTLANRSRLAWAPVPAVLALLAVVILVGVAEPTSILLQGCVFGIGCLLWLVVRGRREVAVVRSGSGRYVRGIAGLAILGVAGGCAVPLGSGLIADDTPRLVLRDRIIPPFDVGQYPSPLSGFRRFRPPNGPGNQETRVDDEVLFEVDGAPEGTPVRIATLDAYDGTVWGAANVGGSPGEIDDTFQRVSSTIRNPLADLPGEEEQVTVTLGEGWRGVWLPTVGAVTGLTFLDDSDGTKAESFRYNLATSTAVVPAGTAPGDRYEMTGVVLDQELDPGMGASSAVTVDGSFLGTQANAWSEGAGDPLPRVLAVAEHLKTTGGYTDGRAPFQRYGPGHYQGRLLQFVAGDQIAGNDEQFAAALALMANQLGVPARVVLGAELPSDGVVRGRDVHAWVEVRVADGSWKTIPTEEFLPEEEPDENPPQPQTEYAGAVVPPSAPVPPPSNLGDPADGEFDQDVKRRDKDADDEAGSGIPAWIWFVLKIVGPPLLLLALFAATVLGLKARRRHRRRTAPAVAARFSGGWAEIVDRARDLRVAFPSGLTRLEQAHVIGAGDTVVLAVSADDHVFGAGEPSPDAAQHYWSDVDRVRSQLGADLNPWQRVRAALSLRSLRRG